MGRSNCFFYAFKKWLSNFEGYVAFRISLHFPGIHWFHISADRKVWTQYTPVMAKKNVFAAAIHKLWYKGIVMTHPSEFADPAYDLYVALVNMHTHLYPDSTSYKAHAFARRELRAYESTASIEERTDFSKAAH